MAPLLWFPIPWTTVKEQSSSLYAKLLADDGFITLAYNAAYQDESEDELGHLEDPGQRVEDIKAAITFLVGRNGVDEEHIGVLHIYDSGCYVWSALRQTCVSRASLPLAPCVRVSGRERACLKALLILRR